MRSENLISACLVVRNEEAVIDRCLQTLAGVVDEIVLVHDGECKDRTLEIAARHGCRIFVRPLVGHAEVATVFAYEQARGEWILSLDADEYLSEPLRRNLRELVADESVNGYEMLWRIWDGARYVTEKGPFRRSLFRRSHVHVLGMIHAVERVDPPVRRLWLALEHRPLYNNYALHTMLSKQRRWARINAREFMGDLVNLPSFNWDGPVRWPLRRRLLNRLSPLLFVPYFPVVLAVSLLRAVPYAGLRVNLRLAFSQAIYASMVQFYELYPEVVDGCEEEGGVPSRLMKTEAGEGRQEGTPCQMFAGSLSGRRLMVRSRSMSWRVRVLAG